MLLFRHINTYFVILNQKFYLSIKQNYYYQFGSPMRFIAAKENSLISMGLQSCA